MDVVIYIGKAEPSVTKLCDLCLAGGFSSPFAQALFTPEHSRLCHEVSCHICQLQVRRRHRSSSFHNKREIPCCFKMSTSYLHELFLKINRSLLVFCGDAGSLPIWWLLKKQPFWTLTNWPHMSRRNSTLKRKWFNKHLFLKELFTLYQIKLISMLLGLWSHREA